MVNFQSHLLFFIKKISQMYLSSALESKGTEARGSDTPLMTEKQQDKNYFKKLMWNTPKPK